MRQLPDIVSSTTFWASVGTLWAAAGAWFTYVAAAIESRHHTYEGVSNLIEGLEAEMRLVSEWASGGDGDQGYVQSTRAQLIQKHPDWFNPSFMVFTFATPNLSGVTGSPYVKSIRQVIRPLVVLNHSIRRLFDSINRYKAFVMGDTAMYQIVLEKFAPKSSPLELATSVTPQTIIALPPSKIDWAPTERLYVNHIFMMNESIHQQLIGGVDSPDEFCLYKAFRAARLSVEQFKSALRQERLPRWYWVLHFLAVWLAIDGLWQVLRWYDLWPRTWHFLP